MSTKSMSDSLENQKSGFGFGEYAETVGPQGLLFVLKGTVFYFTFKVSPKNQRKLKVSIFFKIEKNA